MMVVPLFSKDRIIGTITFFSARPGTYSGQHLKLAESIAAQIAGAVANEQLYAELKQREEQLKESEEKTRRLAREIATVAEIGRIIGSTLDIDEVYERFAEEVRKLIPFDSLVISGINAGERTITFLYASGILLQGRQKGDVFPIADTPAEELLRTGAGLIGDLRPDGDFGRRYSVLSVPYASGLRTMMAIPLVSKDRVIAVLNFFSRRPGVYTGREMDLAGSVAAEIAGAVASARLYVEREQAEASVRKSEAKFRELFDDAPVGYFEYDTQGRLNNVNKTYMEMLGYCAEEMLGHPSWEFSALEEKAHQTILSKLAGALPPDKNFERNFRRKDGSTFPGLITDRLILDEQGKIVGNRAAVQDITERKRAEESLIESQMRLKKAQAIGHLGNWEIDLPTRSVWASEEAYRIYGIEWKNESLPLELVQKAVLPEYRPEMDEALRRLISENKEYDQQYRIKRANDGEVRFLHSRAERILDEKGNVVKVAGVIQDITDRKRTEDERERLQAQLIQAQKMESVGRLAGGVAHDFNNKLSVIIGYGELALEQTDAGSPLFEHLDQILDAARGAADLTRQLLAFARKQTVSPKVLDLNDTTSGMLKMLRRLIGEEINLVWTPGANLWKVKIDPSQIDQILANLAVNARDAISGTGTITLKTGNAVLDENDCSDHPGCVPGKYVMLTVSDTGSGMSKEVMAKIFEPFFTTKGVGKGTGLGLATVYGIVNQNNGFLDVESEPGKRATFNIYLPRFAGEQISVTKEKEGAERGTETILLVEDEISVLNLSKKVLESLGYTILPAQTAEQAIRLIRDHEGVIHLLITDVVMPEMNGKELFEKIAAVKPGLRCLYMSGYTTDVLGKEGVLDEGVHFIQKPFKKNEIAKKISDILKIRP
jgi:two-component system, cell cycle sensor histidine kinase and response regulator CckA